MSVSRSRRAFTIFELASVVLYCGFVAAICWALLYAPRPLLLIGFLVLVADHNLISPAVASLRHRRSVRRARAAAFTLVELVVVIVILAVLAGITVLGFGAVRDRAAAASVEMTAAQIVRAGEAMQVFEADPEVVAAIVAADTPSEYVTQVNGWIAVQRYGHCRAVSMYETPPAEVPCHEPRSSHTVYRSVTITDHNTGLPVAGALVSSYQVRCDASVADVNALNPAAFHRVQALTDANGQAELTNTACSFYFETPPGLLYPGGVRWLGGPAGYSMEHAGPHGHLLLVECIAVAPAHPCEHSVWAGELS